MNQVHELRAVLIGGRPLGGGQASGKSSAGNTILGRHVFPTDRRTARCQKAEGEVHGYHVTLVDTPGWLWHCSVENTPAFDKLELFKSLSLCPPGPQVFLLVLPVDSVFPEIYKTALEEQLEVFGKEIWNCMIVVFSSVTPFDIRTFDQHAKKWPQLHWLLRKCKSRYHGLEIRNHSNKSQVYTLLCKIAQMVANGKGQYCDRLLGLDALVQVKLKEEKEAKKRAQQRMSAVQRKRGELKARLGDAFCPRELRLVVVGASWFNARTTVRCEVRCSEINGRKVTVVDTPGWYYNSPFRTTSEADKLEIKRSVTLSPPGPHAVLLTLPIAAAFNRSCKEAVETHMELFGEEVWAHTMVVFTRGDWLGDTTIEERIATDEPHLEWLMDKCGNRYQVLPCGDRSDFTQSAELLEKIDEMIKGNNGGHFKTDSSLTVELRDKLKVVQSRAMINRMKAEAQRNILRRVFKGTKYNTSELGIVLLGKERSGKSSSGNTILCGQFFQTTLCEEFQIQSPTKQCAMNQKKVAGYHISVVDTPGWSTMAPENLNPILNSVTLCPSGPHAFLLVLSARETFTSEDRQALEEIMKHFGERVWKHTLLLFSHGDWLKHRPIEEHIECEGEALKWLVKKCERRYHMLENNDRGDGAQVKLLLEKIEEMVVRNKGQPYVLEERRAFRISELLSGPRILTEEEWNKREEELLQKLLEAFWIEFDAKDSSSPCPSIAGSYDIAFVPTMSKATQVKSWLVRAQQLDAASSSGYETESIAMSYSEIEADCLNFYANSTIRSPNPPLTCDNTHGPISEETMSHTELCQSSSTTT